MGSTGLVGAPTSDHACTQAWQPPDPAAIQLLAAASPSGQTVTANLQVVASGGAPWRTAGTRVTFTYNVGGHTVGPTSAAQVTVPGLAAAKSYVPTVVVTPDRAPVCGGHDHGTGVLQDDPMARRGSEPRQSGTVGADPNSGSVLVTFPGLPAGPFKASGLVTCGSEVLPISGVVANGQVGTGMNLDQMGGRCSVSVTLQDTLDPDPYGLPSPNLVAPFSIGQPQSYTFQVTAGKPCLHHCATINYLVSYNGTGEPAGTDWRVSAKASGKDDCTASLPEVAVADFPNKLAWPVSCPSPTVLVSWVYLGEPASASASPAVVPVPHDVEHDHHYD